ncbi:MAG: ABC transporter ATP-binding protein [Chloroflexota bacterium]|nr:MAG: ABC transporter ATP-binding protein [Chloroflexota bacterium]
MGHIAIRTENLTRHFGGVRAVDDFSFDVPAGMIFGFLGPNGAGKTTMIRLLLGLLEPTTGRAAVLGFDACRQSDEIRARTGTLLEHTGLYERLSAEENLEFYSRIWHLPASERQSRIAALLAHVGLSERRKERVGTWSRGMKQKLAVARTLLHRPALIFLDEPTAGLDPVAAAALREDLAALAAREGTTVFLTTHNLAEAERLCEQVAIIRQGKLLAIGRPDELRAGGAAPRVEIIGRGFDERLLTALRARPEVAAVGIQNDRLLVDLRREVETAPLVGLVVGAGGQVEEVHKGKASLEDVFLALMEEEQ